MRTFLSFYNFPYSFDFIQYIFREYYFECEGPILLMHILSVDLTMVIVCQFFGFIGTATEIPFD